MTSVARRLEGQGVGWGGGGGVRTLRMGMGRRKTLRNLLSQVRLSQCSPLAPSMGPHYISK